MHFNEEYKAKAKKQAQDFSEKLKETSNEIDQVINNEYNGDSLAYHKDTFNMIGAMLLTGLNIDEIRIILLKNLSEDGDRRKILLSSMESLDKKERYSYPGGYNSYLEDLYNGYYGEYTNDEKTIK